MQVQIKRASEDREAANAVFQQTIADQRATVAILSKVLARLQKVPQGMTAQRSCWADQASLWCSFSSQRLRGNLLCSEVSELLFGEREENIYPWPFLPRAPSAIVFRSRRIRTPATTT